MVLLKAALKRDLIYFKKLNPRLYRRTGYCNGLCVRGGGFESKSSNYRSTSPPPPALFPIPYKKICFILKQSELCFPQNQFRLFLLPVRGWQRKVKGWVGVWESISIIEGRQRRNFPSWLFLRITFHHFLFFLNIRFPTYIYILRPDMVHLQGRQFFAACDKDLRRTLQDEIVNFQLYLNTYLRLFQGPSVRRIFNFLTQFRRITGYFSSVL